MEIRLGQILVEQGILDEVHVQQALARQERTGEPFGLICEQMFDVPAERVEAAWASQYAGLTRRIDPAVEVFEDRALELITRRQAWQFRVLPLRFEPHELLMATTQRYLPRALRFAVGVMGVPVFFALAEPLPLGESLCRHYPLPGMNPQSVEDDIMARFSLRT